MRLSNLETPGDAADHPVIRRDYPVLADAPWMAASPQLRNMASLAGFRSGSKTCFNHFEQELSLWYKVHRS